MQPPIQQPKRPPIQPHGPKIIPPGQKNFAPNSWPKFPPHPLGPQKKLSMHPGRNIMPPPQQKRITPGIPPRTVMPPPQQKRMFPIQPPRPFVPHGQQKKLFPIRPVRPHGPQTMPPMGLSPKVVGPGKRFRARPQRGNIQNQVLCPECQYEESNKFYKNQGRSYQSQINQPNANNYKYHEIKYNTEKNKKSGVIV